jgi:tetratricopeptide (TPR) repeat protein
VGAIAILFVAAGAKILYDKISQPPRYIPEEGATYTPPVDTPLREAKIIPKEAGPKALLPGATWVPQTFNNCGPATTSMILQYFGFTVSQEETKARLRSNPTDTNVFTHEIASYLKEEYNVESKLFYGGDIPLLKKLLANGFYVMVEDWLHPNEDIGHTTILRGYDDTLGVFIADDSYIGVNITYPYEQFDQTQWKPFNREYLPLFKPGGSALLEAIVGDVWDERVMWEQAVQRAMDEIATNDQDMYALFNLGASLFGLTNYSDAKAAFESSRALGWPRRMLWYQIQPVQTYNELGEYQEALELANVGLAANDSFAELHLEKAIAYKGLGDTEKAREEAQLALTHAPDFTNAQDFLSSL